MTFGEFVLSLPSEQYIAWVDHTLPDTKTVWKDGKPYKKQIDPFTRPMKVGNITLERIGSRTNLYQKDIWGITSLTEWKGIKYPKGLIFFHVHDKQEIKMNMAMHNVLKIWKEHNWL